MSAILFIFGVVILILMIIRLINGRCEQQERFSSRTENSSQPNGSVMQHGHSTNAIVPHRVNTTSNVSSSQHVTGCGFQVRHFTGCGCLVNPIRLSSTVERIDDSQEK
ncbi:hypothetical protein DPMN_052510 [Dreissena polymorpha]|uniref:Secreted protein n=1 Tax=Dreissena polymorpha TaxID=45954 RepID=A0A9D4HN32_DREPO|nr:hypothetical protein DPMN_052510 [Dreissena polymorpha]